MVEIWDKGEITAAVEKEKIEKAAEYSKGRIAFDLCASLSPLNIVVLGNNLCRKLSDQSYRYIRRKYLYFTDSSV